MSMEMKWKRFAMAGTYTIKIIHVSVPIIIGNNALFFILSMCAMLCIRERLTRIRDIFAMTRETKAPVLAIVSGCPIRSMT